MSNEERKKLGLKGREHFMNADTGLSAANMGDRFIKDINTMFEKWKPRKKVELVKI
jgi:hypothetical protein